MSFTYGRPNRAYGEQRMRKLAEWMEYEIEIRGGIAILYDEDGTEVRRERTMDMWHYLLSNYSW